MGLLGSPMEPYSMMHLPGLLRLARTYSHVAGYCERMPRSEFLERLSHEIGRVLESVDLAKLLEQLLEGRRLEIKAEFRLTDERGTRKTAVRFAEPGSEGAD